VLPNAAAEAEVKMAEVRGLRPPAAVSDLVNETVDHINSSLAIVARTHRGLTADHETRERCYALLRESLILLGRPIEHGTSPKRDDSQTAGTDVEFWLNWDAGWQASLKKAEFGQAN
jgi:hypothetical protein